MNHPALSPRELFGLAPDPGHAPDSPFRAGPVWSCCNGTPSQRSLYQHDRRRLRSSN